jgi:tetratricopeptide (TPR) repeat protein
MFGFAWLTLRQAQEALKNGRLEEAQQLLEQPATRSHRRAGELLVRLARAYAERGDRHLQLEEIDQAWDDLLQAEALGTADKAIDRLRQQLAKLGVSELRAILLAGETDRAEAVADRLRQRGVGSTELGVLEEGLRGWLRARELADRGELGLALDTAERASRLLGVNSRFEAFRADLLRSQQAFPDLLVRLHEAAEHERWRDVLERAEQVLAIAPAHTEARALRSKAWRALEPATAAYPPADEPVPVDVAPNDLMPSRFWLWIDGVGGYLVCLGNRLTFGQALPGAPVDVPLVADVSRMHATIGRDAEGYVLEAVRPMQINGNTLNRGPLQSGDRVTLGSTCQFLFRLPVPGSMTARIDLVSGHRLPMSVDGVLLMAETLVIGPQAQSHIQVPDLKQPYVLFRHREGLGVRHSGELRVNGKKGPGRALLPPAATVVGEDVSFAVEPTK